MDTKQLQEVETRVANAASEYHCPINENELTAAVKAFLAFDADGYIQAKGRSSDRRVVLWIHALSHFTEKLWKLRQYEHIKALYKEAVKRSDEVGDYGCMDRLLGDFLTHARWFDNPQDYGYGESVPDYERLYAEREQRRHDLEAVAKRNPAKQGFMEEIIKIRLRGLQNATAMSEWRYLVRLPWKMGRDE
mgnify:FL=1